MDQRQLRQLAVEPKLKQISSEFRKKYLQDLSRLDKLSKERKLLPEEFADQGALLIRLNQAPLALETLRKADREYPLNFRILANLSSAWQTLGEFDRAIQVSEQANSCQSIKCLANSWRIRPSHPSFGTSNSPRTRKIC